MCWACVLLEHPAEVCDDSRKSFLFRDGTTRWLAMCFEGDDSILCCCPGIEEKSEFYATILETWKRYGFNMELFIRKPGEAALFTGWKFGVGGDGVIHCGMPDLRRFFCGSAPTTGRGGVLTRRRDQPKGHIFLKLSKPQFSLDFFVG